MMSLEVDVEPKEEKMTVSEGFSPAGLRILVVDDDLLCLMILERMLRQCNYIVETCHCATKALSLLREKRNYFDLVISDVYMPDMDGFKLLEAIGLELDLPVIMMSADGETDVVMKGITHGACDYLLKPVRLEELRNIWQHVIRKRVPPRDMPKEEVSGEWDENGKLLDSPSDADHTSRKRKDKMDDEHQAIEDVNNLKKARVVWSVELHQQFVNAVNQLGIDKAVPKRILEIMNVQGLTRENVASHLQKYRLYLKRLSGVNPQPYPVASFQAAESGTFGGMMQIQPGGRGSAASSSSKGLNLGAGTTSNLGGLGRGLGQIDPATLTTLAQLQMLQQKQQAANALGGLNSNPLSVGGQQATPNVTLPRLQRMDSLELDMLMRAQHDMGRQRIGLTSNLPDLGNLNVPEDLDSVAGLGSLGGGDDLEAVPNLSNLRTSDSLTRMSMGSVGRVEDTSRVPTLRTGDDLTRLSEFANLRPPEDMGGMGSIGLAGDFSSSSRFSSVSSLSNGALSESSFSNYTDFQGTLDFLAASPPDLSLLSQLEAFTKQAEGDNSGQLHGQLPAGSTAFSS